MRATLYSLSLSHPGHAARLMLEHKGIEHKVVNLLPGVHAALVRARGFSGYTVPALVIDGRKIQGSLAISRALDEIQPEPPLFPADPERRREVEEAEAWGESVLQPVPRLVTRWAAANRSEIRRWIADRQGVPMAGLLAEANAPVAKLMASKVGADEAGVRAMLRELPDRMDHVDELVARGVIGGPERNAADFQILTTLVSMLAMDDLRGFVEGRPCERPARELWPDPGTKLPGTLPAEWLAAARSPA